MVDIRITIGFVAGHMAVCQNLVPLVNIKIAGKWMFIPLKMVLIGIDPYPYPATPLLRSAAPRSAAPRAPAAAPAAAPRVLAAAHRAWARSEATPRASELFGS